MRKHAFTLAEVGFSVGCSDSETRNIRSSVTGGKISNRNLKHVQEQNSRIIRGNRAFTLAEVLITLGIIGVVAAITIPTLITNHQKKQTATKLVKAISTLNQLIRLSENENGEFSTWEKLDSQEEFIEKYIKPYTKIMQTCNPVQKCGYKAGTLWKYMNNSTGNYSNPNYGGRTPFLGIDGIVYTFGYVNPGYIAVDNDRIIIIDINGKDKPNQFGKDIFFFLRDETSNSIIPYGAGLSHEVIKQNCSKEGSGLYCSAWIRENDWTIPVDYPFK